MGCGPRDGDLGAGDKGAEAAAVSKDPAFRPDLRSLMNQKRRKHVLAGIGPKPGATECQVAALSDRPHIIGGTAFVEATRAPATPASRVPHRARRRPWRFPAPPQPPPSPARGAPAEAWVPPGSSSARRPALWAVRALEEEEEHPAAQTSWPPASSGRPSSSGSWSSWPPASCERLSSSEPQSSWPPASSGRLSSWPPASSGSRSSCARRS